MRNQIQRLRTALAGRYEIERELGAGGMATVYLAVDARHDRKVAVKVLRDELAAVIGADRFLSEIRTTAHLQHPHILPLFDSGEADGLLFFVMPYVEGQTLADRLAREKQLPIEDALRIASEAAEALDHAHRHGVIHRDVKPANILLYEGRALVADFGIALAVSEASGGRVTETGLSLGTPQYMSPEQAAGERSLDPRTDVFALGCVLYEMLAGEPPHDGPNAQAILARVLTSDPRPLTEIRKTVPPHVAATVGTALQKLPADRFATANDFARALGDPSRTSTRALSVSVASRPHWSHRASLGMNAALSVGLLALGVYAFDGGAGEDLPASPWVTRMSLPVDPTTVRGVPALSPDGRQFAWAASDGVHVIALDQLDARVLPGTAGARNPRFSYDGSSLAFESGNDLRVLSLNVGNQRVLASGVYFAGFSIVGSPPVWSHDSLLYFLKIPFVTWMAGKRPPGNAVMEVEEASGVVREVLPPDSMRIFSPNASVPGTTALLGTTFKTRASSAFGPATPNDGDVHVAIFDERRGLVAEHFPGRSPAYEPLTSHIVFLRGSTLMAAKFSRRRLKVTGDAFAVAQNIGAFGLAGDGTMWSVLGPTNQRIPVTLDRKGVEREIIANRREGDRFGDGGVFSPDGNQIAVSLTAQGRDTADVWVYTPSTGNLRRLTYEGARFPTWSLDGNFVLFSGPEGVYQVRADGSSPAELILADKNIQYLQAVFGGGIVFERTNGTDLDVGFALLTPTDSVRIIVGGKANQEDPAVSPDGRWLAYESNVTGQNEVYVVPFKTGGRPQRVSVAGGHNPLWSYHGRELFFRNGNSVFEALEYSSTPSFRIVRRSELFDAQGYAGRFHPNADGSQFLASKTGRPRPDARFILTRNWARELSVKARQAGRQTRTKRN